MLGGSFTDGVYRCSRKRTRAAIRDCVAGRAAQHNATRSSGRNCDARRRSSAGVSGLRNKDLVKDLRSNNYCSIDRSSRGRIQGGVVFRSLKEESIVKQQQCRHGNGCLRLPMMKMKSTPATRKADFERPAKCQCSGRVVDSLTFISRRIPRIVTMIPGGQANQHRGSLSLLRSPHNFFSRDTATRVTAAGEAATAKAFRPSTSHAFLEAQEALCNLARSSGREDHCITVHGSLNMINQTR